MGLTAALPGASVMLISGNHDSGPRLNCFRNVLSRQNVHMIGMPPQAEDEYIEKIVLQDRYGEVNFYLLPFVRPSMVKQIVGTDGNGNNLSYNETVHRLIQREEIDVFQRNVLVSHQFYLPVGEKAEDVERMDSEIRTVGNIDEVSADILDWFDYAALGHIHKPMKVRGDYRRYCGTPLACSVSEAGQEKGVILVELGEKGVVKTEVLPLRPLRQVRVIRGSLEEVLAQACGDYVTVILTDRTEISAPDMQDRLRNAFPCLLEIRREGSRKADYRGEILPETAQNPYELCCAFLRSVDAWRDVDEEGKELLRQVINAVQEVPEG